MIIATMMTDALDAHHRDVRTIAATVIGDIRTDSLGTTTTTIGKKTRLRIFGTAMIMINEGKSGHGREAGRHTAKFGNASSTPVMSGIRKDTRERIVWRRRKIEGLLLLNSQ